MFNLYINLVFYSGRDRKDANGPVCVQVKPDDIVDHFLPGSGQKAGWILPDQQQMQRNDDFTTYRPCPTLPGGVDWGWHVAGPRVAHRLRGPVEKPAAYQRRDGYGGCNAANGS